MKQHTHTNPPVAPWLARAAEAVLRHPGVDAVVLFGSRARGEPHEYSDWDLCVVGDHEPEDVVRTLLPLEIGTDGARVDVLWRDRGKLRNETSAGTVWAGIVRDGKIIAGDAAVLTDITVGPMKRKDIVQAFRTAADKACTTVELVAKEANAVGTRVFDRNQQGTRTSCAAAEHLSRALTGMVTGQPAGRHDVNADAGILDCKTDRTQHHGHAKTLRACANAPRPHGRLQRERGDARTVGTPRRERHAHLRRSGRRRHERARPARRVGADARKRANEGNHHGNCPRSTECDQRNRNR